MKNPLDRGKFRERLQSHELTVGTFLGLGSPLAAEVAAAAGVDWVLVDCEHGSAGDDIVSPTVIAASAYGVPALVRVESADHIRIGRALDAGAAGVMIPRVTGVDEARQALAHLFYPPRGDRGVATYNRANQWGSDLEALDGAVHACAIVQIETRGALDSVSEIAALDGVDLVFVGPLDLSYALGIPRQYDHPEFLAALDAVIAAANAAGIPAGILAPDSESAGRHIDRGFRFIALSSDSVLLSTAIRTNLDTVKGRRP
jgi:2-dehydro-3-deoxyglucarate aldolase/4-hydroxy-2-oxoheptanedioate aldolase